MKKHKELINWLGLLGVIAFLSYTAAVVFAPLAYPGYNLMSQAVSDLSAQNAPSEMLWNQLAALYNICSLLSIMMVCVYIQKKLTKTIRIGIYLFAAMNWVSSVGYALFPLTDSSNVGFQNFMHVYVVTILVVLLSIISLIIIIAGGCQEKGYRSLAVFAAAALSLMFIGAVGTGIVPHKYFGIAERFSVFAAVGFNAVLGMYLFFGFSNKR
jgi:hypothetical membrane protein